MTCSRAARGSVRLQEDRQWLKIKLAPNCTPRFACLLLLPVHGDGEREGGEESPCVYTAVCTAGRTSTVIMLVNLPNK